MKIQTIGSELRARWSPATLQGPGLLGSNLQASSVSRNPASLRLRLIHQLASAGPGSRIRSVSEERGRISMKGRTVASPMTPAEANRISTGLDLYLAGLSTFPLRAPAPPHLASGSVGHRACFHKVPPRAKDAPWPGLNYATALGVLILHPRINSHLRIILSGNPPRGERERPTTDPCSSIRVHPSILRIRVPIQVEDK